MGGRGAAPFDCGLDLAVVAGAEALLLVAMLLPAASDDEDGPAAGAPALLAFAASSAAACGLGFSFRTGRALPETSSGRAVLAAGSSSSESTACMVSP